MFGWCFCCVLVCLGCVGVLDCAAVWLDCVWLVKVLFCGVLGGGLVNVVPGRLLVVVDWLFDVVVVCEFGGV